MNDRLVDEQEEAAAAEASEIGGPDPNPDADPATRPLAQAGEGESEGFELAEQDLQRNASHDGPGGNPALDAFTPESESDQLPGRGCPERPTRRTRRARTRRPPPTDGPALGSERALTAASLTAPGARGG